MKKLEREVPSGKMPIRFTSARLLGISVLAAALTGMWRLPADAHSMGISFPAGTVVDVTQSPYNALPNDGIDDTAKIQQAINDNLEQNRTLYFPNGTYNLSNTLKWQKANGSWGANLTLQGQSRTSTIFRLANSASGFGSSSTPKPVIVTASLGAGTGGDGAGNTAFHNLIFDLTINTGTGNAGAIGIDFQGSNQAAVKNVTVISGDGQGKAGISSVRNGNGPFLMKNISVTGFDYGIDTCASSVYENIKVQGQNLAGFRASATPTISMRKLSSINSVPALVGVNSGGRPTITLVDGNFTGGSSGNYAIDFNGNMLARNIQTSGYKTNALRCHGTEVAGPTYVEYVSETPLDLWTTPRRTLNLPIKETPEYWNANFNDWAVVGPRINGEPDDTAAIQRAIDSGKSVVCMKGGTYYVAGTIYVRGSVRQILGMGAQLENYGGYFGDAGNPHPIFRIETSHPVSIERLHTGGFPMGGIGIENASSSTLVLKHTLFRFNTTAYTNSVTGGNLFLEDVACDTHESNVWHFNSQNVWGRQFNPEAYDHASEPTVAQVTNNGSKMWLLGLKTEGVGPITRTTNNGQTEVLGAFHIWSIGGSPGVTANMQLHIIDSGTASFSYTDDNYFSGQQYVNQIKETRSGVTRLLPSSSVYWRDSGSGANPGNNVHVVPLYCGFGTATAATGTGTGLTAQYFDNADLTNAKVTRVDAPSGGFGFSWLSGVPSNSGITDSDSFSVKWQGFIQPTTTNRHTLTINSDDGVRVWVNGARLIDQWSSLGTFSASIDMTAGEKYPIVIEYTEGSGDATFNMKWSWSGQSSVLVPISQLYPLDTKGGSVVPGLYKLIARHSGKVLDVTNSSQSNNSSVQQWGYGGAANQKWWLDVLTGGTYTLTARHSGKALSVNGASTSNGAIMVQSDYAAGTHQQWQLIPLGDGYYKVLAVNSGKALEVIGLQQSDGDIIQQWDYWAGQNQQWSLEPVTEDDIPNVVPGSTPMVLRKKPSIGAS